MERLLQTFRDSPAAAGVLVFAVITSGLALLFSWWMLRSGLSLRPLIFFFGFLALVALPQGIVHLLDALAHARATAPIRAAVAAVEAGRPAPAAAAPVAWDLVFGPDADPSLVTDAKPALGAVLAAAEEARFSFRATGESALAARFPDEAMAARALEAYRRFFQLAVEAGDANDGWTGRRYGGGGEWTHVVAAGRELYAWTGASRASVEGPRSRALGAPHGGSAPVSFDDPSRRQVSNRIRHNKPLLAIFVSLNLVVAVLWFFKAAAWAGREAPEPHVTPVPVSTLRSRLLALNQRDRPLLVTAGPDSTTLEVTWNLGEKRWFDALQVRAVRRIHKFTLRLDPDRRTVRMREYLSRWDASAGPGGLRLEWKAGLGLTFFSRDYERTSGVELDPAGRPTGDLSPTVSFDLQAMRSPVVQAVLASGWTWQPLMVDAPPSLRWLTE